MRFHKLAGRSGLNCYQCSPQIAQQHNAYIIWQDTFNRWRHHRVRLLDCRRHQQQRRSNNIGSTFRMQLLGCHSSALVCPCKDFHNHFWNPASKYWRASLAFWHYLAFPLRCSFALSPILQMVISESRCSQDRRLSRIRHSYVSFSRDFQKNFECLLRNVSYSLGYRISCWVYHWLGFYNVDKIVNSASAILSKWKEIAVVFEIQQRTKVKLGYAYLMRLNIITAEDQVSLIALLFAAHRRDFPDYFNLFSRIRSHARKAEITSKQCR